MSDFLSGYVCIYGEIEIFVFFVGSAAVSVIVQKQQSDKPCSRFCFCNIEKFRQTGSQTVIVTFSGFLADSHVYMKRVFLYILSTSVPRASVSCVPVL